MFIGVFKMNSDLEVAESVLEHLSACEYLNNTELVKLTLAKAVVKLTKENESFEGRIREYMGRLMEQSQALKEAEEIINEFAWTTNEEWAAKCHKWLDKQRGKA